MKNLVNKILLSANGKCYTVLSIISDPALRSAPSSFFQLLENKGPFCYLIIKFLVFHWVMLVLKKVIIHNTSSPNIPKSSNCLYFFHNVPQEKNRKSAITKRKWKWNYGSNLYIKKTPHVSKDIWIFYERLNKWWIFPESESYLPVVYWSNIFFFLKINH